MSNHSATSMVVRYRLAAQLTAPKIAAQTPEVLIQGYWVSDRLYFYLEERLSPSGRMLSVPHLVDAVEQTSREVISLECLATLLSEYTGAKIDPEMLADAEFEMPDGERLAVRAAGRWYVVDWRRLRVVGDWLVLDADALYSPDGAHACFLKGNDLWLRVLGTGGQHQLTYGGVDARAYGRESDTCLAAISYRKRPYPVGLWSPDSQWFLSHRIDERSVPEIPLVQHVPGGERGPLLHTYRFSIPGDPLPLATFVAINVASGRMITFESVPDLVRNQSPFTLGTVWFTGNTTACFIRFDRYFKTAELFELNLVTGEASLVVSETASSGYLDAHPIMGFTPNVRVLNESREIVWYSERDGWGHLYLYDGSTGELKNRITSGRWLVRDIVHVDQSERTVLFLAGGVDPGADPARRSLCSAALDGTGWKSLLNGDGDIYVPVGGAAGPEQYHRFRPGTTSPGISPDGRFAAVRKSSLVHGNCAEIISLRGEPSIRIFEVRPPPEEVLPEEFTALAADRVTPLHGAMFFPPDFDRARRYPLVDFIYPGPQSAHKPQSYRSAESGPARAVAALGFITIMLDSRGTPLSSRSFHHAGYGRLKEPQLADHAAVVRELCQRHAYLDPSAIGIMGYSAGGSATVQAMCDYGDIYRVGVSVCGEHDASLYNSMWSDKYRGPATAVSQPSWAGAERLRGNLLLIAGDMDENVPMSQSFMLLDALIRANRNFDLIIIPNGDHNLFLSSAYAQRRIWDFLVHHLLGESPPDPREVSFTFGSHELDRMMKLLLRRT